MQITWALISLCSSANSKYFSRISSSLFVHRGSIESFMQAAQHKRSRGGEVSRQSIKRRMTIRSQYGTESSNTDNVSDQRSPYEVKLGKSIRICPKCNGESKVRANLSKKARAKRKETMQQKGKKDIPFPTKPCTVCDASGLIAVDPKLSDEDDSAAQLHDSTDISVAIVGGGIGGVALAAALQHRNIPCKIYERDVSFEERKQGYGLTMQQGARALRALGFFSLIDGGEEEDVENGVGHGFKRTRFGIHSTRHVVHRPDGTIVGEWGMKVWGGRFEKNGKKHAKRQNAHISRQNLRSLLMEMLRPDTIEWGYKFAGYSLADVESGEDESNFNKLKLKFRRRGLNGGIDGNNQEVTTNATILVGCDGIRSAVRAQKLGSDLAPLRYLDCIVILGITKSPLNSHLTDGETVFQTADGVTRLYAMPFANAGEEASSVMGKYATDNDDDNESRGLSMWQLSFPMNESDAKKLSSLGPAALKQEALKRCSSWHEPIPELLKSTPQDLITGYPCYDRDLVDKDNLRRGCDNTDSAAAKFVTMLGDSCHPMSPFKGQGANQALLDAVLLARKIHSVIRPNKKMNKEEEIIHSFIQRIPTALGEFEDEMIQRSSVKVKKSAEAAKFLHSEVAISEGNVTRGAAAAIK